MSNVRYFVTFASSAVVFASLVGISNFVDSRLKEAGYDIPEILLFGFSKDNIPRERKMPSSPYFRDFKDNGYLQLLAIAFAAASAVFIFVKFSPSESKP
jgi:cytochrome-b5 reductase